MGDYWERANKKADDPDVVVGLLHVSAASQ